jgi:hypothetical protein
METIMKMFYWKGEKFWVGKLLEHPEIMTQRRSRNFDLTTSTMI